MSFWKGQRVFITHCKSFLGAWLTLSLLEKGAQVFGLADESSGSDFFDLNNLGQKINLSYGDLCDQQFLNSVLESAEADIVFHLGPTGSLIAKQADAPFLFSQAAVGTTNLLEALRNTATIRAFVNLSSDKVYRVPSVNRDTHLALNEDSPLAASGPLVTAKLVSELITESYRKTYFPVEKYHKHKVALVTARLGAAFGGGDLDSRSLVASLMRAAIINEKVSLRNPNSLRPWIYIKDQIQGLLVLAEAVATSPKYHSVYNFSASGLLTVEEFSRILAKVASVGVDAFGLVEIGAFGLESNTEDSALASVSRHLEQNSELAFQDLGWKADYPLETALKETFKWYKEFYSARNSDTV